MHRPDKTQAKTTITAGLRKINVQSACQHIATNFALKYAFQCLFLLVSLFEEHYMTVTIIGSLSIDLDTALEHTDAIDS